MSLLNRFKQIKTPSFAKGVFGERLFAEDKPFI